MSVAKLVSREGRRRLTLLNPATAFHETLLAGEERFPRILLDQKREDSGRSVRKSVLRERDFKRFGKLGVSRTRPHGIEGLPDAEFISLHDLSDALEAAKTVGSKNIGAFLEQVSERLKRDADLIEINELVGLLQQLSELDHFDLSLINKVKNEVVYDMGRIRGPELAVLIHTVLEKWNVVSPRLIMAAVARAEALLDKGEISAQALVSLLNSLHKAPRPLLLKQTKRLEIISAHLGELSFSELAACLKSLVLMRQTKRVVFTDLVKLATPLGEAKSVPDVLSGADALFVMAEIGVVPNADFISSMTKYAADVIESATISVSDLDTIAKRNTAVDLAATVVAAASRLRIESLSNSFMGAITAQSVRGLKCHQLVSLKASSGLSTEAAAAVQDELVRKSVSLSPRQRAIIETSNS